METKYASATRSSTENLLKSKISLGKISFLNDIFCSISLASIILDDNRQIVYANDTMLKSVKVESVDDIIGKRYGEAISCRYAFQEEGGCGTTEHCRYCGTVNATLQCQKTKLKTITESRIREKVNGSEKFLDIEVTTAPFVHENADYTIFSFTDISDRKRRAIIERMFFHDIMNAAVGVQGFFELFESLNEVEQRSFIQMGSSLSKQIIDEIVTQRLITQAENHELVVNFQPIDSLVFINQIACDLQFLDVAKGKKIVISENSAAIRVDTDPILLRRILNNMVKNALEASTEGQTITLATGIVDQKVKFSVQNPKFIPRDIEMQVFMRSFSTKGAQRGIGTYSMKILGEQHLGGKVDFTTTEMEGTTFFIIL